MDKDGYHGYYRIESPCQNCEYHSKRAQFWRDEAYRQAGHPLPEREWVGLTDEEVASFDVHAIVDAECVRAIEAKLKEKNT